MERNFLAGVILLVIGVLLGCTNPTGSNGGGGGGGSPDILSQTLPLAGENFSLAIETDGSMWGWGADDTGQLGNGGTGADPDQTDPISVGGSERWITAANGSGYVLAISENGTLWGWGDNEFGQIGDGTSNNDRFSPVQVGSQSNWTMVAAATGEDEDGYHSLGLRADGTVWYWGDRSTSTPTQLGSDTDWSHITANSNLSWGLKSDGTLWSWDRDGTNLAQLGSDTDWETIDAGYGHRLALKDDGTLWAWGSNFRGQVGNGTTTTVSTPTQIGSATDWSAVAAGTFHSMALKSDGTLYAWGQNTRGEVGDGTTTQRTSPVQVGTDSDWVAISAGYQLSIALKDDGSLWAWGRNLDGEVGDGTTTDRNDPVRIYLDSGTYSVTYNANGATSGSTPTDSTAYDAGATVTVAGNPGALSRGGDIFIGWNTANDGSGTRYVGSDTFTIGAANETLYAQFSASAFTITYDTTGTTYDSGGTTTTATGVGATSGTAPVDNGGYLSGDSANANGPGTLTYENADGVTVRFLGWTENSDGTGSFYAEGDAITITSDITLYPRWSAWGTLGTGPAGGTVFYDDEEDGTDDIAGLRYLSVAPEETEWTGVQWGLDGTSLTLSNTLGGGAANTATLVSELNTAGESGKAAQLVDGLTHGGASDWVLPTWQDFNQMMRAGLHAAGLAEFPSNEYYWTSVDGADTTAIVHRAQNQESFTTIYPRTDSRRVRAIRQF